jgi:pectate lyase
MTRTIVSLTTALIFALPVMLWPSTPARAAATPHTSTNSVAFPGAQGWAAHTPGGRGGKILRVTTLAGDGPGSFVEAVTAKGPRIVVFEVGGVIDLGLKTVRIKDPYLTIAGQTAPQPGITLIRGGLDIATHDVVVRHLRVRPGEAGQAKRNGVDFDAISTVGAHDVIVDHCSLTWATDENLSASGPRFGGDTPAQWRENTSHRITFSHNLIAESLAYSSHGKGEHSKGSLIHDNARDILIVGNLYAHNYERNPMFKGASHGMVVNNLIYNPGQRAIHYNLIAAEWDGHPYENGRLALIGNAMRAGPDTPQNAVFFMFGGSGDVDLYLHDNIAVDRIGEPLPLLGRYSTAPAGVRALRSSPALPFGVTLIPAKDVQDAVIANAGARPWDRDDIDRRILADTIEGRGEIIDSEQEVGGYPKHEETRQPFVEADWNIATMEPLKPLPRRAPLR